MRTRSCSTTALVLGTIALAARVSCALAAPEILLKAPFDFRAGSTHFGPGAYILVMAASGSVTILSSDRKRIAVVQARRSETTAGAPGMPTPVVSFRSHGDMRFLAAIQVEGSERWDVAPSEDEAVLVRQKGQPTVTILRAETIEKNQKK